MSQDIFADEWRECMTAHYMDVIRRGDKRTEDSLTALMMGELGFREDELRELRVMATMHVDDVRADFVPDLEILESEASAVQTFISISEPELMTEPEMEAAPEMDEEVVEEESPSEDRQDGPQQLSLF